MFRRYGRSTSQVEMFSLAAKISLTFGSENMAD